MRMQDVMGKDWVLKLVSLGFAITLWFFVVGEEKAEVSLSIPIEIVNLPPNLVISNDIPPAIDVRVYGPRSMIKAIASQGLSRVIDLRGASAGHVTVQMTPDSLPLPGGLRVMRIQPSHIDIVLERLTRKTVPVRAVVEGKPNRDYQIKDIIIDPPAVTVEGPASEISRLQEIKTLPINLNGATDTVVREVSLDLQGLHSTVEGKGVVKVTVNITPTIVTKRITHIPVFVEASSPGVAWWPQVVSINLQGWVRLLRNIHPKDIKVVLSIEKLPPGVHQVVPRCVVPKGVKLLKVIPPEIKVEIPSKR